MFIVLPHISGISSIIGILEIGYVHPIYQKINFKILDFKVLVRTDLCLLVELPFNYFKHLHIVELFRSLSAYF